MCPPAQGSLADSQLVCHALVVFDFVVTFVQIVIQDQVALVAWQQPKAPVQAFKFDSRNRFLIDVDDGYLDGDLLTSICLPDDISRHAVEESRGITFEVASDIREPNYYSINSFVGQIFGVVEPLGDENSDETGPDVFIYLSSAFSVGIQPT